MSPDGLGLRVDSAIAAARRADFDTVRTLLQIPPTAASDTDLLNGLIALKEGLVLFEQDRHTEAANPLARANRILGQSADTELRFAVALVSNLSTGMSKLLAGDAHGAHSLLDLSADAIKTLAFFKPEFSNAALKAKAMSHIALARTCVNSGNLGQAEYWIGKADEIHDDLLRRISDSDPSRSIWIAPILATRLEVTILFARVELDALQLNAAKTRLQAARPYAEELSRHTGAYPTARTRQLLALVANIYSVLVRIHALLMKVIVNRQQLSATDVNELAKIDELLFATRQLAQASGDQGVAYIYTINQLNRLQESLLQIGKATKADFGRFAGLISLGSLVVLMVVTDLTVQPTGWQAAGYFLGELVISLIVGFGYGALRFKPLLTLIADTLRAKRNRPPKDDLGPQDDVA